MVNRWIGILCIACMLSANTALIITDVVPGWFAGDPPRIEALKLEPGQILRVQVGIYNQHGHRIGASWMQARPLGDLVNVRVRTHLWPIALPGGVSTPEVLVRSSLAYTKDGRLDKLNLRVDGLGVPIVLEGESFGAPEFPMQWQVGDQIGKLTLPAEATRALGDVIRPFDTLPNLFVGRTWRLELIDPLSKLMPGLTNNLVETSSVLVRVVAEEQIKHLGEMVDVFRVESHKVKAWVTAGGRVIRQEVELPLFGTLILVDEPYNEREFHEDPDPVYER